MALKIRVVLQSVGAVTKHAHTSRFHDTFEMCALSTSPGGQARVIEDARDCVSKERLECEEYKYRV